MNRGRREQLRQQIQEILITDWDPLLVTENALAKDEYNSYIAGIRRMLDDGCDAHRLSSHLDQLETVSMGLSAPSGRAGDAAAKLLAIRR